MQKFMILCLLGIICEVYSTKENWYSHHQQLYSHDHQRSLDIFHPNQATEYFTFSAPADSFDLRNAHRLTNIIRPQRVIFIRTPERNIFSIAAEQLAIKDSLNIYVFRRDTNTQGLLSQLEEIRQKVARKPIVEFVKYKTPEDIELAKKAIYHDYESLPGSLHFHENTKVPVLEFESKSHQLFTRTKPSYESPVIFKIIKHKQETTKGNEDVNGNPKGIKE